MRTRSSMRRSWKWCLMEGSITAITCVWRGPEPRTRRRRRAWRYRMGDPVCRGASWRTRKVSRDADAMLGAWSAIMWRGAETLATSSSSSSHTRFCSTRDCPYATGDARRCIVTPPAPHGSSQTCSPCQANHPATSCADNQENTPSGAADQRNDARWDRVQWTRLRRM